jgi:hypothetical protein
MKPARRHRATEPFDIIRAVGLRLPGVKGATKYDGSPVLKVGGCFMAGLATHPSAEPDTLVVRVRLEDREHFLEDAAETYYITDYYLKHPVVLARLARLDRDALQDLLASSRRLTLAKSDSRRREPGSSGGPSERGNYPTPAAGAEAPALQHGPKCGSLQRGAFRPRGIC